MGHEALLQEAAQPDSMAPAVHRAQAVAAKAQPGSPLQLQSGPLCPEGLRTVSPLPQYPEDNDSVSEDSKDMPCKGVL